MPPVDLEALVSVCGGGGGSDRKIACETQADANQQPEEPDLPDVPPDFPPESFWLSKDDEFDWFDRNAFYERKESTKGNSNSTNPNSISSSQRFSANLKSKASIIGLPKTQKTSYIDTKRRNCKPVNIRFFPQQSESVGKAMAVSMPEPSSPKVSCMGRVRSKRGPRRSSEKAKTTGKSRSGCSRRNSGFCGRFMSVFQCGRRENAVVERDKSTVDVPPRKSVTVRAREIPFSVEPVAEPPSLGGMMRFSSGRRSASSWVADDLDQKSDVDVARS